MELEQHSVIRHQVIEGVTDHLQSYNTFNDSDFNAYYFSENGKHYRIEVDRDYVSDVHEVPWIGY